MIKITTTSEILEKTDKRELAELKVKVDDVLFYEYESYDSVGMNAEYKISDLSVLIIYKEKTEYHYPEKLKKSVPGSDSGKGIFYFKAIKPGKVELTINHTFRRKQEREMIYKITVE
jgi:hypothetical protein